MFKFSDIYNILSGIGKKETMENRLYLASVAISIILCFVFLAVNFLIEMPISASVIVLFGLSIFIHLLYEGIKRKKYYINFFIGFGLLFLSISWLYNGGISGSVNYIYILALMLFLSMTPHHNHRWILLLVVFNLVLLHLIFYIKPDWIYFYDHMVIQQLDMSITLLLVILFVAIIYKALHVNYEEEKYLVEVQMTEIELQHKYMKDSIHYARDIQSGILQKKESLAVFFDEYFIFWRPKDIVSGDFYIFKSPNNDLNKVLVVVGDCTGHGVPGAFLTILGMSFFNEIILKDPNLPPNEILNQLREKIKYSLSQGRQASENRDGMDMIICLIDKTEQTLQYSGSNRSVYIARGGEIIEHKGDRMPIGVHVNDKIPFTNYSIDLQKEDSLYLFTDGYADQYGEQTEKKFFISKFKKYLLGISKQNMLDQGQEIMQNFDNWKGDTEQTDDVLVVGIKPLY